MSFEDSKRKVAIANRILAELGLATGLTNSVGHASMRVPEAPDRFVIKGRGYDLDIVGLMKPEDMVVCDLEGHKVEAPSGVSQCYEVKMHSCIYRAYPEVQSVVHVHPRHIILISVLEKRLRPMSNSGARLVRNPVPIYPHSKLILTDQDGSEVAALMKDGNKAVLLKGHGAVTSGRTLEESVTNMLQLEEQAMLNTWAWNLAGRDHPHMSDEMLDESAAQPPFWQVPHFDMTAPPERPLRSEGRDFRGHGFWAYYVDLVSRDL